MAIFWLLIAVVFLTSLNNVGNCQQDVGDLPPGCYQGIKDLQCSPSTLPLKRKYFHYNQDNRQCQSFKTRCKLRPNPEMNIFRTFEECNRNCDICKLPAKSGMCLAYFPRYYYNEDEGDCIQFIYGGCGGNENNFETIEECQHRCAIENN